MTGISPDFITVDDGAGGTGAAPIEFSTYVGSPLLPSLFFVHSALRAIGVREEVTLIAAGGVCTGFDMVERNAYGADVCVAGRSFMIALGCVQALACSSNVCPSGIATQHRGLSRGIVPETKADSVMRYHKHTVRTYRKLLASLGYKSPRQVRPTDLVSVVHGKEDFSLLGTRSLMARRSRTKKLCRFGTTGNKPRRIGSKSAALRPCSS